MRVCVLGGAHACVVCVCCVYDVKPRAYVRTNVISIYKLPYSIRLNTPFNCSTTFNNRTK